MQVTLTVKRFLEETDTNNKHFSFVIRNCDEDEIVNLSVAEVCQFLTHHKQKLSNLDIDAVAAKYAKLRGWQLEYYSICEGV